MSIPTTLARSAGRICLAFLLVQSVIASGSSAADTMIICSELADRDRTRAVIEIGSAVSGLEIVTPEHAWSAADLPHGKTGVSPNLLRHKGVVVTPSEDAQGRLRILDFSVQDPDALELEGLRGSLVLHEDFFNKQAFASLYYTATGNLVSITALVCERIDGL